MQARRPQAGSCYSRQSAPYGKCGAATEKVERAHLRAAALQRAAQVAVGEGAQQLPGARVHHQQAPQALARQLAQRLRQGYPSERPSADRLHAPPPCMQAPDLATDLLLILP
jgi:hypothetical protein